MKVILNEFTGTVHKQKAGLEDRHTACGVTRMLAHDNFQMITAVLAATEYDTSKCGRCFEGEWGYYPGSSSNVAPLSIIRRPEGSDDSTSTS